MSTKPKLRWTMRQPWKSTSKNVTVTRYQLWYRYAWRTVYLYTGGHRKGTYFIMSGKGNEVRFKTLNELNQDIT